MYRLSDSYISPLAFYTLVALVSGIKCMTPPRNLTQLITYTLQYCVNATRGHALDHVLLRNMLTRHIQGILQMWSGPFLDKASVTHALPLVNELVTVVT